MDESMVKEILDWAYKHDHKIMCLDGRVNSLCHLVSIMKESNKLWYKGWKSFDGFVLKAVDDISRVVKLEDNDVVVGTTLGGNSDSRSHGRCSMMENIKKDKMVCGIDCVEEDVNIKENVDGYNFNSTYSDYSIVSKEGHAEVKVGLKVSCGEKIIFVSENENRNRDLIGEEEFICFIDDDNDKKMDDNMLGNFHFSKIRISCKERQLRRVYDLVAVDQEEEILMEKENVNFSLLDILYDISEIDREKLENDVHEYNSQKFNLFVIIYHILFSLFL